MRKHYKTALSVIFGVIILTTFALLANWEDNGVPICTDSNTQNDIEITTDGAGGAIITWTDDRNGNEDIYSQRVDPSGNVLWTADGVAVTSHSAQQCLQKMVHDGSGGAIIAWTDLRNLYDDIYAQMIDASGTLQGPVVDIAISTSPRTAERVEGMISDGGGGAIIVWHGMDSDYNVYAQRVDSNCTVRWRENGVPVCSLSYNQRDPKITADGTGGAVITWTDGRNGTDSNIYAQRLDADGTKLWAEDGVAICSDINYQNTPYITSDGVGGAIITWQDLRSTDEDIYAQRVDANGNVLWTTDGIAVCSASANQRWHVMTGDGSGGVLLTWWDDRNGNYDIYAQRLDTTGTILWTTTGVPVCTQTDDQMNPTITTDGSGGAIITWDCDYTGADEDIYAQRIDASGNAQWTVDGVPICSSTDSQWRPEIIEDSASAAIITWQDYRSGTSTDIYAQKINGNGIPGYYPCPYIISALDVPNDQGGKISLQWQRSVADTLPNTEITHYSVWRRLPLMEICAVSNYYRSFGDEPDIPADFEGKAVRYIQSESGYAWEWLTNIPAHHFEAYAYTVESLYDSTETDTGWQYFMVSAHTESTITYYDSPIDSGYSVDNLAPGQPQGLAGEQSFTPEGLTLSWDPNSETDLGHYALYRGMSEDFSPGPGNIIASPSDTIYFDDGWQWEIGYYYKVSAVDVHGNESIFALLRPDEITGSETPTIPISDFLRQNYPNPFNPSTMITFGLNSNAHVDLQIYNAAGQLVRNLVDKETEAGIYHERWDGRDNSGHPVSSGIYFYRLVAGDYRQTKKMVLLR